MANPSYTDGWHAWQSRVANRVQARLAARARLTTRFIDDPDPYIMGSVSRGKQLISGSFHMAGTLIEAPGRSAWHILPPTPAFHAELHGFGWLDDLAALADPQAEAAARSWVMDWIARFSNGSGPGWAPELAGRRLLRLINHGSMLLALPDGVAPEPLMAALARHVRFLARRWQAAPPGLPRFEALAGLIVGSLKLDGMQDHAPAAIAAIASHCAEQLGKDGGLPGRNPEQMLDLFLLLALAGQAIGQAGRIAGRAHLAAIERMAPTLRGLRHANGRLARFHGGGPGPEGRLDQALAASGIRTLPGPGLHLGFARLSCGRTSVIVDAQAPPRGSPTAHASTLALELTSGRRPLIVNCGSGADFGPQWHQAGRQTASHSTLILDDQSSSRFTPPRRGAAGTGLLASPPQNVTAQHASGPSGHSLIVRHDGYVPSHGLTHIRRLNLSADGRALVGEDTLGALTDADKRRFGRLMNRARSAGLPFVLRFHLHPDIGAATDPANGAIHLALPSGEDWLFRQHGGAVLSLEPSVYLDKIRLKPRATKQIVLSGVVIDYASQVSWTLAKTRDTPQSVRDVEPGGSLAQD